jgi:hypothetical protein
MNDEKEINLINEAAEILEEEAYYESINEARDTGIYKHYPFWYIIDKVGEEWPDMPPKVKKIYDQLQRFQTMSDSRGAGSGGEKFGVQFVKDFLRKSRRWKGEEAKKIKSELKKRVKRFYSEKHFSSVFQPGKKYG